MTPANSRAVRAVGERRSAPLNRLKAWVLLILIADFTGLGVILPLLPFFATRLGASPLEVTLLIAMFPMAQIVGNLILGVLSERFGRPATIRAALALSICGYVLMALAPSMAMLFLGRAIGGFASGKLSVVQALVADCTEEAERAAHMGMVAAAYGLGSVLGPVLGAGLAGPDPAHPDTFAVFASSAALCALGLAAALVWTPHPNNSQAARSGNPFGLLWRFLRETRTWGQGAALAVTCLYGCATSALIAVRPLWMQAERGWGARENGYVLTCLGLGMAAVQFTAMGALSRRLGDRLASSLGMVLIAIAAAASLAAVSVPELTMLAALHGVGSSIVLTTSKALLSKSYPPGLSGAVMGSSFALLSVSQALGPLAGGWVFENAGADASLLVTAVVCVLAATLAILPSHIPPRPERA